MEKRKLINGLKFLPLVFPLLLNGCRGCDRTAIATPKPPVIVAFDDCFEWQAQFDKKAQSVVILLDIMPGYHAYGTLEKTARPLGIQIDPKNGWEPVGAAEIPTGKHKRLQVGEVYVVEGAIQLKQKVEGGVGSLGGVVNIQICTDAMCDRPKNLPFSISTQ